jgi:hypothetical protein
MSSNWLSNIRHVAPGEPVQAGVVSRPDRALTDRTEYLKQRLDAAALGQALFDVDATVAENVLPGQPVFWNPAAQRYELAFAAVESDPVTQALVTQASSDVLGLCYKKKGATLADIVLGGVVKLPEISNAVSGSVDPGRYYLSAAEPGKLVKDRPPVMVSVCYVQGAKENCADDPWVIVMPQIKDILEDHIHYRFELVARPAGEHDPDAAALSGYHTIDNADDTLEGWLPANAAVFQSKAPAGAKFGYNFSQHDAISRVWPPQPMQAVAMLWDKGINRVGAAEIPLGSAGLCVVDLNGIWWMADCYGEVPWPSDLNTTPSAESESAGSEPSCPTTETMRLIVVFLRMLFGNDRSVVTSLKPAEGSPITVTNCDGLPASTDGAFTGDLELGLNLQLLDDATEVSGGRVYKQITNDFKFRKGWVAEGVRINAGPLTLTSTRSRLLTTAEKESLELDSNDTSLLHQGLISLSYNDQLVEREISPQIIRLADTVERLYLDIPYLGFPESQDALMRVRLNVPSANLGSTLQLKLRVQLFGRASAALPPMYMTYRRIPRPGQTIEVGMPVLPNSDTALDFPVPTAALPINTPIEVDSEAFTVAEGDTILVTLSRAGTADSYAAEVGLLRLTGVIIVPGAE